MNDFSGEALFSKRVKSAMARQKKLDSLGKEVVKSAYVKAHKNFTLMSRILGVSRNTLDKYLTKNPDILLEFELAEAAYIRQLENTLRQMALGKPEIDSNGKFVRWIVKPNADVLIKEAEARMRYLGYGKQLDVSVDAKVEGDMKVKAEMTFALAPMRLDNDDKEE